MSPQFVKPYVKSNKNDMADAEAGCEAVNRPNMRFVSIKTVDQLSVYRARQGLVKARTAQANQIRGPLSEFGIVMLQGIRSVSKRAPDTLEDAENGLPETMQCNKNVSAVTLANKNTRVIWALLAKDTIFHPNHTSAASAA